MLARVKSAGSRVQHTNPTTTFRFLNSNGDLIDTAAEGGGFSGSEPNVLELYDNLPPGVYTISVTGTTPLGEPITGTLNFLVNN